MFPFLITTTQTRITSGYLVYRAYRIPDLYPHPAEPVTDLVVSDENQIPLLEFSADPTHSYLIQGFNRPDELDDHWNASARKGTSAILILRIWTRISSRPAFIAWSRSRTTPAPRRLAFSPHLISRLPSASTRCAGVLTLPA